MEDNKSVEDKLGDLIMQGWTLLADHCFIDSCHTPLVKENVTNQIYCVGCEAWVFTKERTKKEHRFNELVALEGKRNVDIKQSTDICKTHDTIKITCPSFRTILEHKMNELCIRLQNEKDIYKCNELLDALRKIYVLMHEHL